jgi:hypothetical protein
MRKKRVLVESIVHLGYRWVYDGTKNTVGEPKSFSI